jgi:hypothetical protein
MPVSLPESGQECAHHVCLGFQNFRHDAICIVATAAQLLYTTWSLDKTKCNFFGKKKENATRFAENITI